MGCETSKGGNYFFLSRVLSFSPFKDPQANPFFFFLFFLFSYRMARGQEETSTS